MPFQLDESRRTRMIEGLRGFYLTEFDEELSAFRAGQLVDFVLDLVAPGVYNQAVQDARRYMQTKLDDLDAEIYHPDITGEGAG